MKNAIFFAGTIALAIGVTAWLACLMVFPAMGEPGVRAIVTSAGIAFSVQCLTFGVAMVLLPVGFMVGWGAGVAIRVVTLIMHGFIGVRLLDLPAAPALLSLAIFFFMTSLIEPFFLNRSAPHTASAPPSST